MEGIKKKQMISKEIDHERTYSVHGNEYRRRYKWKETERSGKDKKMSNREQKKKAKKKLKEKEWGTERRKRNW